MKPRIYKVREDHWSCIGGKWLGWGKTPQGAYWDWYIWANWGTRNSW